MHAWALTSYFILGFTGLAGVFRLNSQSAVINAMGPGVADVWGTVLMIAGFGAFVAAITAANTATPEHNLRLEMYLNVTIFFAVGYFLYISAQTSGWRAFNTVVFASVFIMGSALRSWQIHHEINLIRSARRHPTTADPVMGDPRDEEPR